MRAHYLEPNLVPPSWRTIGGYSGRTFQARPAENITISDASMRWDGGSRSVFYLIANGQVSQVPELSVWPEYREQNFRLEPGIVVAEHVVFCGKDMGLTFHCHPNDVALMLAPPAAALSDIESIVLSATCGLKASYGGLNRRQMVNRERGWKNLPPISEPDWEAARARLIAIGYLNKAGAATPKGRNARG